jgi:hypothetical protein
MLIIAHTSAASSNSDPNPLTIVNMRFSLR